MHDADPSTLRLAELLRHPDDLDKISTLKAEFTRKKAAVDGQLKQGLKEQLQLTQAGMNSIHEGQRITNLIKDEMMNIDKLCAEAQNMIRNFPEVNAVARIHQNFVQVEAMKRDIETYNVRVDQVEQWLAEDAEDMQRQPNLLRIHDMLTKLRNIRDDAKEQFKKADDTSLEDSLNRYFDRLDDAVDEFDEHVGKVVENLIPIIYDGGDKSLIVRVVTIINAEEKYDHRVRELQDAQKDFKDMASRFESLKSGPKELRGYKDKFLQIIKSVAEATINGKTNAEFMEQPDRLEKSSRWFFNDLNTVKLGMTDLMPRKWKIFSTYVNIYHEVMRQWLTDKAADPSVTPTHMLAIIHWKDKYNSKMEKLGVPVTELEPPLPGGPDSDLVREYAQLIVTKVEQWTNQMNKTDRQSFLSHNTEMLYIDENGYKRTKMLSEMWHMLREQLIVAGNAELTEVIEGVVDAILRALKIRQEMWSNLVTEDYNKHINNVQETQDWLAALANDHFVSTADIDESTKPCYMSSFRHDCQSLVSREYTELMLPRFETLKNSWESVIGHSITAFVKLIINIDFKVVMTEFFTPAWYERKAMGQITLTYDDYLTEYSLVLPKALLGALIDNLSEQLVMAYLSAVRNKAAKFRRQDPFELRIRDDVTAVFDFFNKWGEIDEVRETWRVLDGFNKLIAADREDIVHEFEEFLQVYWDVRLSWIEAVLRARDDIDWTPIGDGKKLMKTIRQKAVEHRVEKNETIMKDIE